jgi:hypothetical protein
MCRQVLAARLCAFNNATCGGFQALAQHGYLSAQVQNTGSIAADYTITVCALPTRACKTHLGKCPVKPSMIDSPVRNKSDVIPCTHMQASARTERCMVQHQ